MIKPNFKAFTQKQECLFGAMLGDIMGCAFEFKRAHSIIETYIEHPLLIPASYRTYKDARAGVYTDDFSQILCVEECLTTPSRHFPTEMMLWKNGKYWVDRQLFDIGNQTNKALIHYEATGKILSIPNGSGNGGTMRLAPLAFYNNVDETVITSYLELTHNNRESLNAAKFYMVLLGLCLSLPFHKAWYFAMNNTHIDLSLSNSLGSGYVIDTLASIKYCMENSYDLSSANTAAIKLGNDTDTTALHVGSVAALCYGLNGISDEWLEYIQPSLENKYVKTLFDLE